MYICLLFLPAYKSCTSPFVMGINSFIHSFVVVSPSAVGDMSCMIIVVELKFGQVLASDANIQTDDGQDVATIRRRPGTDGCYCMTRQPIEWKRKSVWRKSVWHTTTRGSHYSL